MIKNFLSKKNIFNKPTIKIIKKIIFEYIIFFTPENLVFWVRIPISIPKPGTRRCYQQTTHKQFTLIKPNL